MLQIVYYDQQCLNDGSKISYHSFTTLADEKIKLKIERDLPEVEGWFEFYKSSAGRVGDVHPPFVYCFLPHPRRSCVIELII